MAGSGRTMARSGLRMMPTSPSSPLKSVRRVFPGTASRLAYQTEHARADHVVKPAPGIPTLLRSWLASFVCSVAERVPALGVAARHSVEHRHAGDMHHPTPGALTPVRVLLSRSIIAYLAPSVPLAGTARFRRTAVYTRCLRCAGAPRRPTSGSVLSLHVPSRHATLHDPGEFAGCMRPAP
jgi:hypothetical protein